VTGDVEHIGGTGPGYVIKGPDPSASLADAIYSYGGSALPSNPRVTLIDPPIQQYLNAASNVLGLPCLPIGAPLAATAAGPAPLTTGNQQFCPAGTFNLFSSRYESNFFEDNLFTNMRAEANWNLGSATLTVLPSFRQVKDSYVVLPLVPFKDKDSSYASSLEIRLGNAAGPIIWTVGAFLFHEDQHIQAGYDGVSRWDLLGDSFYLDHLTEGSQALFGQVTVSVAPDWRVIGGLRQTRDRKTIDGTYQVTTHIIGIDFAGPNVLYPGAPPGECFGQGSATMNCIADRYAGDRVWNFTSYKTGIEHDLTERNMLYFTFAVGQKSGGFNDESVQPGQAATFNPETVKAFELGARNRFLNDTLQVNPEAFFWRYDAAQQYISVQTPEGGNISALANVGLAESYGLDLDLRWRFTSADMLHVGTEYLHSRFERFTFTNSNEPTFATSCTITPLSGAGPNESIDCAGKPLTHAPEYSGSASWTHVFTFRNSATLDATLSGRFASSRELTIDYSPQSRAPAYSEGDFNLAYTSAGRKWRVAAFIHNFNNALVYTGGFSVPSSLPGVFAANLAAPRTFGARASVDF
jgi:iron complex outermembrane receptor protein